MAPSPSLPGTVDEVAEWLRRWTANPMCSARVGSNPILVASPFHHFFWCEGIFVPGHGVHHGKHWTWDVLALSASAQRQKCLIPPPGIEPGPAG